MGIARVFPRRTNATPGDPLAFVGSDTRDKCWAWVESFNSKLIESPGAYFEE